MGARKVQKNPKIDPPHLAEFACACKLENALIFCLETVIPEVTGQLAAATPDPSSLDSIPEQYPNFTDVFSKAKASILMDHIGGWHCPSTWSGLLSVPGGA